MMNILKKLLLWLMIAILPVTPAFAQSAVLERAAAPIQADSFAHYPSYFCDEATGLWRVQANEADALLDRFWAYDDISSTALCVFHLGVEGNAATGVWSPVLRVYYNGQRPVNATAVSLLADGVRYDMAASSGEAVHGDQRAELITVPLTAQAAAAMRTVLEAESVSLRLMGDNIYTTALDPESTNNRRSIEAASLAGLSAGLALLEEAGLAAYQLWDLSASAWESRCGYAPAFAASSVNQTLRNASLTDAFGMVLPGQQGRGARAAQEILMESGFLGGSAASTFGDSAVNATRRAQRYLGRIVTGCMDAQTEQALLEGRSAASVPETAMTNLGSVADVGLNRWWFASAVSAQHAFQPQEKTGNGDHLLLVADGCIRNLSPETLYLFMQLEAQVIYNETYRYEAEILCQRDEGTLLDTTLVPMGQSRLMVCAELPAHLAQDKDAVWRIELTAGGQTAVYDLQ